MHVLLVHHAEAVGPAVDPQRPLSAAGRAQAGRLADAVRALEWKPDAIWHSGKLRARQTAEALLRACNPSADFRMVRGLQPDDPPAWIRDQLVAETRRVAVVGHMPHIAALALVLCPDGDGVPAHGAVGFDRDGEGQFVERWRSDV
jgi:phosphohistidine phosphatase